MSTPMDITELSIDIYMMLEDSKDSLRANFRSGQCPVLGYDERPDFESVYEAIKEVLIYNEGELYERAVRVKAKK